LRIAQLIAQFLDANLPLLDITVLQATYRADLERNGFLTSANVLSSRKLANAIVERFGEEFMREIHMPPKDSSSATPVWAQLILMKNPSTRPLEHCRIIFSYSDPSITLSRPIAKKQELQNSKAHSSPVLRPIPRFRLPRLPGAVPEIKAHAMI
jgi:hypothetical protein